MKKVLSIFACAAVLMVSCKPNEKPVIDPSKDASSDPSQSPADASKDPADASKDPTDETIEKIVKTAYIESVCDWPEENDWKAVKIGETKWEFIYDEYGHLTNLKCSDKEQSYIFDYSDNFKTCQVVTEAEDNIVKYSLVLNDNLLCIEFTNNTKDPAEVWTYDYDADGYQIKATTDGEIKTEYAITNGNIFTWSRGGDRYKEHRYGDIDNVADIHTSYSEDAGLSRLFYETGLFGRSSAKVCEDAKWQDRDTYATYEYEYDDATGGITHEIKYYGGDYDFDVNFEIAKKTFKK